MRDKLSPEQIESDRRKRREKRSAFLSRMVDEFKKIALIALFFVGVGGLIWCFILYSKSIMISPTIPCTLIGVLFGAYFTYCYSSSKDKDSLNKNGLSKSKDGSIAKIVSTVVSAASDIVTGKNNDSHGNDAVG